MKYEENLAKFLRGDVTFATPTQEVFDKLMDALDSTGIKWVSGVRPSSKCGAWGNYGVRTDVTVINEHLAYGDTARDTNETIVTLALEDFDGPTKVFLSYADGNTTELRATVHKDADGYHLKEVHKFDVGDTFVTKNGILGKVMNIFGKEHTINWVGTGYKEVARETTYDVTLVTGEQLKGVREVDMKEIVWND